VRLPVLAVALLALAPAAAHAADAGAIVLIEDRTPGREGLTPEGAPPRFALMPDGQVYVGGTSVVLTAKLPSDEARAIEKRVEAVRRLPGLAGSVTLGDGPQRFRVVLRKGRPIEMSVSGDPATASAALQPLAALIRDLSAYHHPSLRPYAPKEYMMSAHKGTLPGGCRANTLPASPKDAVFAPRRVSARVHTGWPTGAIPASVCVDDDRYVVTLKPIIPGL
jgi:hypothetical protein